LVLLDERTRKYGFLHVNGKLAKHLGVEFGKSEADVSVSIEPIEKSFGLILIHSMLWSRIEYRVLFQKVYLPIKLK
jgi:hypothetical protein